MIKAADKSMFPALIHLWQQSFGDSKEYIQMFLDWNFDKIKTIVYITENKTVSVAYLLPTEYVPAAESCKAGSMMQKDASHTERECSGQVIQCMYLYAAATLPEYRGRGYFAEILAYIKENIPEPVFLVPGEKSLISYYERQGLYLWQRELRLQVPTEITGNNQNEASFNRDAFNKCEYRHLSHEEYYNLREQALEKKNHIRWDRDFMQYICRENQVCGGNQVCMVIDGAAYIAIYRTDGEVLHIRELLPQKCAEICVRTCAQLLLRKTGCKIAQICVQPPVMINRRLIQQNRDVYFNLTLG